MSDKFEELLGQYWGLAFAEGRDGVSHGDEANEVLHKLRASLSAPAQEDARDAERLDWLDEVNRKANERNATVYGWKFNINHNRAALTDSNIPALSVRAAIDAAMKEAGKR